MLQRVVAPLPLHLLAFNQHADVNQHLLGIARADAPARLGAQQQLGAGFGIGTAKMLCFDGSWG